VIAPGTFDTWKILFSYGREADDAFRLWIAAEAGIVRIESLNAKHSYKPWRLTLSALDLKRPDRTLPVPRWTPARGPNWTT
jgi:hypothetical protein